MPQRPFESSSRDPPGKSPRRSGCISLGRIRCRRPARNRSRCWRSPRRGGKRPVSSAKKTLRAPSRVSGSRRNPLKSIFVVQTSQDRLGQNSMIARNPVSGESLHRAACRRFWYCAYQKPDHGANIARRGSTYFPFGIVFVELPVILGSPHVPVRRRLDSERGSLVQCQLLVRLGILSGE
jgi:hypothetical protein